MTGSVAKETVLTGDHFACSFPIPFLALQVISMHYPGLNLHNKIPGSGSAGLTLTSGVVATICLVVTSTVLV